MDASGSSTPHEEAGPERAGSAPGELASDLANAYDEAGFIFLLWHTCTLDALTRTLTSSSTRACWLETPCSIEKAARASSGFLVELSIVNEQSWLAEVLR